MSGLAFAQVGTILLFSNHTISEYLRLDSNQAGNVYTLPGNGGPNQKWILAGDNPFVLKNLATGLVLDGNEAGGIY